MINMKKFVLGIFLILLVSGCSGMPDIFSGLLPGGNSKVNTTEASPDLIVIQNLKSIPSPPINSKDTFSVTFEIVNQEEVEQVPITYELFDYGLCTPPTSDTKITTPINIAPLGTEFKEWVFTAPSNDQIAGLPTKCPIRFKINYVWEAKSQIDADVISRDRYDQLQRTGQFPSFTPSLSVGRGPIKIYLSFGTTLPMRTDSTLPIFITVEDKGYGLLGNIPTGALTLNFGGLSNVDCGERFTSCGGGSCSNAAIIPMISKKSPELRCTAKAPSVNIEKTFYITASLSYSYDLVGEVDVEVKPFLT